MDLDSRLIQSALENFEPRIVDKIKQIHAIFCLNPDFLGLLEFLKWYSTQLKR
jgi:hypothetical protein